MKKYSWWFLSVFMVFSLVFTACAAPKSSAPAPAPAPGQPTPTAPQLTSQQQLVEAAKKEGEVVLWTQTFGDPDTFVARWRASYPSIKLTIYDAGDAVTLVAKITEEAKAGRYSADTIMANAVWAPDLNAAGLVREYDFPNVKGWSNQPTGNLYRNLVGGPLVPVYNTKMMTAAEAPKTYKEVNDTKWRGKGIFSTSSRTSSVLGLAYLWRDTKTGALNWDGATDYWRQVIKNTNPMIGSGFTGLLERVAAGEFPLFLFCTNAVTTFMIKRGAPVAFAQFTDPVNVSPTALMIAKKAPHPNAAQLFVDWMTQKETTLYFAELQGEMSYHPDAAQSVTGNQMLKNLNMFEILAELVKDPAITAKSRTLWDQVTR